MEQSATEWVEKNAYEGCIDISDLMRDGFVIISGERLAELVEDEEFLGCLVRGGVDNWSGFEEAQNMWEEQNA